MNRLLALSLAFALCLAATCASASCRDDKDGEVATLGKEFATADAGVYAFTPPEKGVRDFLVFGRSAKFEDFRFCAYLELPPSGADSAFGLYFWRSGDSAYEFAVLNTGTYSITHHIFNRLYDLVPPRPIPNFVKEPARMREIDIQANHWGASVKLDGRLLTDFVARPPGGETTYGLLVLQLVDKPIAFRFAPPIKFGK